MLKKALLPLLVCTSFLLLQCNDEHPNTATPPPVTDVATTAPTFISLSDIHFNPFYDRSIVMKLVAAEAKDWKTIYDASTVKTFGQFGNDSNYPLFESALEAMKKTTPSPDFITITGDFISHHFRDTFQLYTGITDSATYNQFVAKTITFIALELTNYFPATTIIPALGNNDSYCGDYELEPGGEFLRMFTQVWAPILLRNGGISDIKNTFPKLGHYTFSRPGKPGQVMLVFNSVFLSSGYSNDCGDASAQPGKEELAWLRSQLDSCERNHLSVWMICHIPPGVDVYSTLHKQTDYCTAKVKLMWMPQYNDTFLAITKRYSKTLTAGLAGHTHMDDFRVIGAQAGATPYAFFHISPSISPRSSNNPGFQVMTYDRASFTLVNCRTYYFPGLMPSQPTKWMNEFNFDSTYNVTAINAHSLYGIWNRMASDSTVRNSYMRFYDDDQPASMKESAITWRGYWSGIANLTPQAFTAGACQKK